VESAPCRSAWLHDSAWELQPVRWIVLAAAATFHGDFSWALRLQRFEQRHSQRGFDSGFEPYGLCWVRAVQGFLACHIANALMRKAVLAVRPGSSPTRQLVHAIYRKVTAGWPVVVGQSSCPEPSSEPTEMGCRVLPSRQERGKLGAPHVRRGGICELG
jgi:hypothetical protein